MNIEFIITHLIDKYHNFDFKIAILLFFTYLVLDLTYAKYIIYISEKNEYRAATFAVLVNFLVAFGVISYTHNWLYLFPLSIGSWLGTYYAVKKSKNSKPNIIKRWIAATNIFNGDSRKK